MSSEAPLTAPVIEGIAWEEPKPRDWLKALIQTIREILTQPTHFFQKVAFGQDLKRPLWFAIIINTTMFLVAQAFNRGLGLSPFNFQGKGVQVDWLNSFSVAFLPFAILFMAVCVVLSLFVSAGVNHFCLYLLGAANRNFEQTLRVVCYSAAPFVLCFVPVVGAGAGWLWSFVLTIIGLKTVHRTSTARAVLACLLPILVCCGLGLLVVLLGATAFSGFMMGGGAR